MGLSGWTGPCCDAPQEARGRPTPRRPARLPQQPPCYQGLTYAATVWFGAARQQRRSRKAAETAPNVANRQRNYLPERLMTTPIADAALLAAWAPGDGVLDPRDERDDRVYLDLRTDRPAVARSRLASVARAFGPRLQIQEGLRLLIATGDLAPSEAAAIFSRTAFAEHGGGPPMAVLRGEDVLDQLEVLVAASSGPDGDARWVLQETRSIATAFAAASPNSIRESFSAGANVVFSRLAPAEALKDEVVTESDKVWVTLALIESYELVASLREHRTLDYFPSDLRPFVAIQKRQPNDVDCVVATSKKYDHLAWIARRVELALGSGTFDSSLVDLIHPIVTNAWFAAPMTSFEAGYDLRPASEWLDG